MNEKEKLVIGWLSGIIHLVFWITIIMGGHIYTGSIYTILRNFAPHYAGYNYYLVGCLITYILLLIIYHDIRDILGMFMLSFPIRYHFDTKTFDEDYVTRFFAGFLVPWSFIAAILIIAVIIGDIIIQLKNIRATKTF